MKTEDYKDELQDIKIQVLMNPHKWDNEDKPYNWTILQWHQPENDKGDWVNRASGWAKTPTDAWEDAVEFYNDKLKEDN